jgi:cation diffusion facilitator family transporter
VRGATDRNGKTPVSRASTALGVTTTPVTSRATTQRYARMRRVLLIVLAGHLLLAGTKGGYGLWTGSLGMAADGLHSLLHALGTMVGLIGVALAARPPDRSHPYGYERYEPLAALGIVGFMFLAVREILAHAWGRLAGGEAPVVTVTSFVVMGFATGATLLLAIWERLQGQALGSEVLTTDGQRALADVLVSGSVLAGLSASLLGLPWADLVVALGVAGMIGWAGWSRLRALSAILTDAAVADIDRIAEAARRVEGVRGVHGVRARGTAGAVRVDLHVAVDPTMPAGEAHELTHRVVKLVQSETSGIAEVLVHVGVDPHEVHHPPAEGHANWR